jgi:hypothetical protein
LIVSREGLAGGDHWTTTTLHGRVLRLSSSRTAMATRGRCSLVVMLYPHRNRGAHSPAAVGVASPRQEGAPRPAHEGGRRVRRLGTNGMAETEAERGCDGLSESRGRQRWGHGQNEREGPSFIAAHHAEQCGPVEGGDSSVQWQSGRTGVRSCGAEVQRQQAP